MLTSDPQRSASFPAVLSSDPQRPASFRAVLTADPQRSSLLTFVQRKSELSADLPLSLSLSLSLSICVERRSTKVSKFPTYVFFCALCNAMVLHHFFPHFSHFFYIMPCHGFYVSCLYTYQEMLGPMFFGETPTFDELIAAARTFEERFNASPE